MALAKCTLRLGEIHCYGAQADYHHQKFAMFEHVDSPARLIKEIVRPARPRRGYHPDPAVTAAASPANVTSETELTPV